MKKIIYAALLMAVLCLAACGGKDELPADSATIARKQETSAATPPAETAQTDTAGSSEAEQTTAAAPQEKAPEVFGFRAGSVLLIPGEAFDSSLLPEPASVYKVPSCAIEGTDNVYSYGAYEVTAYDEGKGEIIYSIYFVEPSVCTAEGLGLGDDAETVTELYGEEFDTDGDARVYTLQNTKLQIIIENDTVTGIEYLLEI